jgi:RHH-type proline utilization regulon transcriptional repressor/proline dehydrogenase/delta 1-pyrroline-5-carboxylate dehydrogenase
VRINSIADVEREIFGPVLHVATYEPEAIDKVIGDINGRGYGLTFGLHTRIDARVQHVIDRIHAGNIYINRNQIGAVVGSQPFGGEGLSGTGPKAGGPHYLRRFRKSTVAAGNAVQGQAASMPKRFSDASKWAQRSDRIEVLRKHLRGKGADAIAAAAVLDYGSVDLPGPTGESNTLALNPRGRVLCLGPDGDSLLAQVVQALAAGNSVVAVAPNATAVLQPLLKADLPVLAVDGTLLFSELASTNVDVVAYSRAGETARQIRQVLAERNGPIVPIVSETIYPAAYAHERSVCVDTTAAGGNASLLAAS